MVDEHRPVIIAMKGHPGTGKSTLAHAIAAAIRCPLLDKDDVRDCTWALQESDSTGPKLLNELSYDVLWKMAKTQLQVGLSVVIDSPLSRRAHLDSLLQLAAPSKAHLVIVECKPSDEHEWRHRLENRGVDDGGPSWHKPTTWQELQRLVEGYRGCNDYELGHVPRIIIDTTGPSETADLVSMVLQFVNSVVAEKKPIMESANPLFTGV